MTARKAEPKLRKPAKVRATAALGKNKGKFINPVRRTIDKPAPKDIYSRYKA